MALPFAALTGDDSILVRHFQSLNWSNGRTPRCLVRHMVDDLATSKGHPFLAKPLSIPELLTAIEQQLPVRGASHVSL